MTHHSPAARLIPAVALAAVLWLTLRSADVTATDITPWWCLACGPAGSADFFQNLLLLLPLGVALRLAGWRSRRAVAALIALPVAIELTQALLATGRDAALGDVVANATGGVAGWWLGGLGSRLLVPDARMSQWAAPIGLGLFVAQLVATASLAGPSLEGPEPWRLRLAPATAERPTYRGAIVSVALGGEPILTASPRPAQRPRDDAATLEARFTWQAPPSDALTPIIRLDDARHWAIAAVDARGGAIGVTLRTHAGRLRWRTPTWLVPLPPARNPGDTVRVTLDHRPGVIAASAAVGTASESLTLRFGAQHGWALINPFTPVHRSALTWQWWTVAWLFGWGLLLGWSACGARLRGAWWAAALLALVAACAVAGAGATWRELAALGIGWWVWPVSSAGSRRSPAEA